MSELDLGQRIVVEGMEWTTEEVQLLADASLTLVEVSSYGVANGPMTINDAIGGVLNKHLMEEEGKTMAVPGGE